MLGQAAGFGPPDPQAMLGLGSAMGQFPAPPGFVFGNDPASQQMQAAQNQAAMQYGYIANAYGPYLDQMLAEAPAGPTPNTPVLDSELKGLKNVVGAGKGKAAKAGLAVLDAQTKGAHGTAAGLAEAGAISHGAIPSIADAAMSQQQNALYGPFSQQAVAIAGQQSQAQQQGLQAVLGSIASAITAGNPPTPDEISSIGQLYGLDPGQIQQLIQYASSAGSSTPTQSYLGALNPNWATADQQIQTFVQQSKGKTLRDVLHDVYGHLVSSNASANGGIPYWDPHVKAVIDNEVTAMWTLQQQTLQAQEAQQAQQQQGLAQTSAPAMGAPPVQQTDPFFGQNAGPPAMPAQQRQTDPFFNPGY